jgi:hypothetical protein
VTSPGYTPAELATLFAKIERQLTADPRATLEVLARTAVDTVPGCQLAGVSIGRNGRFTTPAATDEVVRLIDQLQYEGRDGPCVDAIEDDTTFNVPDLRAEPRWPNFSTRAVSEHGILSVLSIRMYTEHDADIAAGLNMYSREVAAFDDTSETVGMLLATHGALAVSNAVAREKADNLMTALQTSREIGIAMGVLMQKYKITRDEAFSLLRMASQALHRKLALIAVEVAETGELPEAPPPKRRDQPS